MLFKVMEEINLRVKQLKSAHLLSKFIFAARCANTKVLIDCLENGVDPNCIFDETTALHIAAELGSISMILVLLFKCEHLNVNVRDSFGDTPLNAACQRKINSKVIAILLKNGANPNVSNKFHRTPLFYAVTHKNIAVAILLIKHNADVDSMDAFGNMPLSVASVEKIFLPMVKLLLNHGANPNLVAPKSQPLLLRACMFCNNNDALEIISYLLDHGADVQILDPNTKQNALHIVSMSCKANIAIVLLRHEIDILKTDSGGKTPLMIAKIVQCSSLVQMYQEHLHYSSIMKKMKVKDANYQRHSVNSNLSRSKHISQLLESLKRDKTSLKKQKSNKCRI